MKISVRRTINPVHRQTPLEIIGQVGAWNRRERAGRTPEEAGLPDETMFGQLADTWNNGAASDADGDAVALPRRASGHCRQPTLPNGARLPTPP